MAAGFVSKDVPLPVGSYWFKKGGERHVSTCISPNECIFFINGYGVRASNRPYPATLIPFTDPCRARLGAGPLCVGVLAQAQRS